ncbi:hypothetical protein O181_049994 [Austropuccinia psidii MF-1]|uniref:Integrase zinc-binding domain-containing protein n=1 Tax=Austropuccinia psidii MF-1 TaxID=1389203 RepID=A0A9Q3HPA0_9BASI|nr:hypothetical protein [Austropuccinia psidii MF-1]
MEIDRRKDFKFFEWAPEFGTLDSDNTEPEGMETLILVKFFNSVTKAYSKHKHCSMMLQLLQQEYRSPELEKGRGALHASALTVIDGDHSSLILQECHDCPYMGHMSEGRTKERVASTAGWPQWEEELSEYINTCERFQKE